MDTQTFHLTFEDLYTLKGLRAINEQFHTFLKKENEALFKAYVGALANKKASSDFLLHLTPYVEAFLGSLFNIHDDLHKLSQENRSPYLDDNHKKTQKHSALYGLPQKQDFENLVNKTPAPRTRDGFHLTDHGISQDKAAQEALYCLYCHDRDKDSCSKGLVSKKTEDFETNPLGNKLEGCPLSQKISEMNLALAQGQVLGALAIICIDNPLVALTGHRICNACSKACIFQKHVPVQIPSVESYILQSVLKLPYGLELYSLLTKWNPLNIESPLPLEPTHKKVLVAGMGPAGLNLTHHLLQKGHDITGIEALKVEPLPQNLKHTLIKNISLLDTDLEERVPLGFGGVSEYGITVRWNKNYLNILHLMFMRREHFNLSDNIRFGSTLTKDDAFHYYGFDHIALCLGAGKPKILNTENALPKGVHTASDFLMALHMTQPHKRESLANFMVRLPVVVIGGGLTSIDTATEALAYYPRQVAKFKAMYDRLSHAQRENLWTAEEQTIATEFLAHAKALEKAKTATEKRTLLDTWGGVTLIARRTFNDIPAYRLNHEEIEQALAEGIHIHDETHPTAFDVDEYGWVKGLSGKKAKTVFYALGTTPNTLANDGDDLAFKPLNQNNPFIIERNEKGQSISYFGDLHPKYNGSVVAAMASGKDGAPFIDDELQKTKSSTAPHNFISDTKATVHAINRLTPTIIEVVVHAPLAAKHFKPGQFYRFQNYAAYGTPFEPIALTGAEVNHDEGTISLIALEMGASSFAIQNLKMNEPVALMGPTGTPSIIPENKNVLLIGGGLGNAVLFSIGKAMGEKNCHVTYVAGYKTETDIFKPDALEAAADKLIWCTDQGYFTPPRKTDTFISGNVVDALKTLNLESFDYILTIGSDRMMHAVKDFLLSQKACANTTLEASINAPMQCMMKEICGRCLQKHTLEDGTISYVFSCTKQDQNMRDVHFGSLKDRLSQNTTAEKLMNIT